jgi:hypothetical protein
MTVKNVERIRMIRKNFAFDPIQPTEVDFHSSKTFVYERRNGSLRYSRPTIMRKRFCSYSTIFYNKCYTRHLQFKGCYVISLLHVIKRNIQSVFTYHVVLNSPVLKMKRVTVTTRAPDSLPVLVPGSDNT